MLNTNSLNFVQGVTSYCGVILFGGPTFKSKGPPTPMTRFFSTLFLRFLRVTPPPEHSPHAKEIIELPQKKSQIKIICRLGVLVGKQQGGWPAMVGACVLT